METLEHYCIRLLEILSKHIDDDPIQACGIEILNQIISNPEAVIDAADKRLHVFPFSNVEECWKRLYTDASVTKAVHSILSYRQRPKKDSIEISESWLAEIVKFLDMPLIMTGAPKREAMIHELLQRLEDYSKDDESQYRYRKRRKTSNVFPKSTLRHPELLHPIPHAQSTRSEFATHIASSNPSPISITSALKNWPACKPGAWDSPSYLLSKTFNGRRLVPIELGTSYTSDDFGQSIITFRDYMERYLMNPIGEKMSYLAQHDLFTQIPALRKDILIPEYCSVSPQLAGSTNTSAEDTKPMNENNFQPAKEPIIKAWLGPAGTLTPLHTDRYHNILAQVIGSKYVRLYPPSETSKMYQRGVVDGIDMSNTSQIPVELVEITALLGEELDASSSEDEAIEEDIRLRNEVEEKDSECHEEPSFPQFPHAKYVETVLKEGECLYIPVGWWHYVRSLSTSFSVSFWWN